MMISDLFLAGFLSFFIGVLSAILGLGGGFLLIPMYTLLFGLDPVLAIGTSLTTTIFTSGSASICHARNQAIPYRLVLLLVTGSVPSIIVALYLTRFLPPGILILFFSFVLFCIAIQMMKAGALNTSDGDSGVPSEVMSDNPPRLKTWREEIYLVIWGIAGGLTSGFSGISGGIIFVPGLFRSGVAMNTAVAVSLATIIFTSSVAATMSILLNQISYPFLGASAAGVIAGAVVGVRVSPRLRSGTIQYFFSVTLMVISLLMVYKSQILIL